MIFVDTNILLDVANADPRWSEWSVAQLEAASLRGPILVNDVVYAEFAVRYEKIAEADEFLTEAGLELVPMPRAALFLAGKAFLRYRRAGGAKTGVLPDFFIGAHASVLGVPLLTRDGRRYLHHFPNLQLITPSTEN